MTETLAFIVVEFGPDQMRVWQLNAEGQQLSFAQILVEAEVPELQMLENGLRQILDGGLPEGRVTPVVCVGLAQDPAQPPRYDEVPCQPPGASSIVPLGLSDPRLSGWLVPGLAQRNPDDVMQLEAIQLAGFIAQNPKFDGVVCLPGLQSKWVRISAEEVVSFQSYMTGQMVDLLSHQSALRAAVKTSQVDKAIFLDAVSEAMSRPQAVAAKLFGLHAAQVLSDQSLTQGKSALLGMLIGMELAGSRPYWLGMDIAVVGTSQDCALYSEALSGQGCLPKVYEGDAMTFAGVQGLLDGS